MALYLQNSVCLHTWYPLTVTGSSLNFVLFCFFLVFVVLVAQSKAMNGNLNI